MSHNWSGPYYLGGGFTIDNSPYGDVMMFSCMPSELGIPFNWNGFIAGEGFNGTLSATFPSNTFNPSGASSILFYWGDRVSGGSQGVQNGVYLGSASNPAYVPDTGSTAALL